MAENTENTETTETNGGNLVGNNDANAVHGIVTEIADKDGKIYDIASKQFANSVTVELTGDTTGTNPSWNGKDKLTIATTIPVNTIVTDKIKDSNVTTAKIADGAVTLDKIASDAKGTNVALGGNALATQAAVKTYVDDQISGKGSYLGKKAVADINTLDIKTLHNGDRVMTTDAGSIVHGEDKKAMAVVAGEDLILYKVSDTDYEWQSIDGNFKLKGEAKDWSDKLGGDQIITGLSQNANGDLTVTTGTITSASGSDAGIAKLYSTTGQNTDGSITQKAISDELATKQGNLEFDGTYDAETNKVATVSTVTTKIGTLDAEVTSTDGANVQVKVTEVDGKITAVNVTDASAKATDLSQEVTDRKAADKTLQDNIDAEATARGEADTALGNRITALEGDTHTHANKGLLDTYTQTEVDLADAVSKKHSHANATVLAGITAEKVTNWDTAADQTHTHDEGQTAALNSGITSDKVSAYDTHTADTTIHITASERSTWNAKQDAIADLETIRDGAGKGATALQQADIVSTYSGEGTAPINGTGVKKALETLDATKTSTDGTNVQVKVTQEDGKITAVNITTDNTVNSTTYATDKKALEDADDAIKGRLDSLEDDTHTHSNKTTLDEITDTKVSNWDTAYSQTHTHTNKSTLDGITDTKVTGWDNASAKAHEHANATVLDGIDSDDITAWDSAASQAHTHTEAENAALASGITSDKVSAYDTHVADTTVHITASERSTWNAKQNAIDDLETIRTGAGKGATAVQPNDNLSTLTDDITVDTYTAASEAPISGKGVKAALDTLDATVTSTDGTNVQVKVTETDGKITAVNITKDDTVSSSQLSTAVFTLEAADTALQNNIDKKQDAMDIEYDAANHRLTFKNVTFSIASTV